MEPIYCDLCQGIIPWLKSRKTVSSYLVGELTNYEHQQRLIDLETSCDARCPLCRMFFDTLSETQRQLRQQYEESGGMKPFIFSFHFVDLIVTYNGSTPNCSVQMQFYSLPLPGRSTPLLSTQSAHLLSHPLETNTLQRVMIDCIECDPDCCRMARDDYLPRRLIDVGPPDGSREPMLVETFELQHDLQPGAALNPKFLNRNSNFLLIEHSMPLTHYVTLSHCWGSTAHAVTTTKNLDKRREMIPMVELSKTFQDAVTVTRYLQVQYLWIDSLCILQDSKEDWVNESQEMHLVYNNAVVNIAAISAKDGNDGFLHHRLQACELPLSPVSDPGLTSTNLWLRPLSSLEDGPLDRRAWVFQESILAPRTLSFGKHEAFFRCRTHRFSEKYLQEIKYSYRLGSYFVDMISDCEKGDDEMHLDFAKIIYEGINTPEKLQASYKMWRRLVEVYSTKDLTFGTDKLPAIAGIATQFGVESRDRYLAGLWMGDLPQSLLWVVEGDQPTTPETTYIAPSWSWASQSCSVEHILLDFDTQATEIQVQVIEATLKHAGENVYGQILSGHLRLRGKMLGGFSLRMDEPGDLILENSEVTVESVTLFPDNLMIVHEEDVWCLLLATDRPTHDSFVNYAMLLQRDQKANCTFRRIGIAARLEPVSVFEEAQEMNITLN